MLDQYPNAVKLVIKNFPSGDNQFAAMAAAAALAANEQNKFWDYHERLFENHDSLDEVKIRALAHEVGLDLEKFDADRQSPRIQEIINRDINDGLAAGFSGIPAVFINGKQVELYSLQGLQYAIDSELKEGQAVPHPKAQQ